MINNRQAGYGDIFLVDFDPSTGHEFQKMRPAIVIESDEQIKKSNLMSVNGWVKSLAFRRKL